MANQSTQKKFELIDQFDLKNRPLLDGIQGNILKAHGRHFTANVFIRCNEGKANKAKAWLGSLVDGDGALIQSAYAQLRTNVIFKGRKPDVKTGLVDTGLFACIHISAAGYNYLFGENAKGKFTDKSFSNGMPRPTQPTDSRVNDWEIGLKAENHFMLLLAHEIPDQLAEAVKRVYQETDAFSSITTIERGKALFNKAGDGIEHFGYVDGISQPLFFEEEWETYKANNAIKNGKHDIKFDPRAEKELVLIKDPFATKEDGSGDENAWGSYFVFQKLEQNVKGFKLAESVLSDELKLEEGDEERAGAMLVGRFEDGTPVQLIGEEGLIQSAVLNNFDYELGADKNDDNSKCPFHAHIRKTNPRSGLKNAGTRAESMEAAKRRIMARRGITYGTRTDDPNDGHIYNKPEKNVGLLFMSYQRSIEDQFEFIQMQWADKPGFPSDKPSNPGTSISSTDPNDIGIDPIIGQGKENRTGEFAPEWGKPIPESSTPDGTNPASATFDQFVHLKGGDYFFAPSMAFLKGIIHTITDSENS